MLFPNHPLLQAKVAMWPAVLTNRLKQKPSEDLWESPTFLPSSIPSSLAWNIFLWITLASVQISLSGTQLKIPHFFKLFMLRKHGGKLHIIGFGNDFLNMDTKAQIKEKIDVQVGRDMGKTMADSYWCLIETKAIL